MVETVYTSLVVVVLALVGGAAFAGAFRLFTSQG